MPAPRHRLTLGAPALRYFIPEWDDKVDPDYDFLTDTHSRPSGGRSGRAGARDVYAHELFPAPCYDGVLVSKVKVEAARAKRDAILKGGIRAFLRLPAALPLMGDCGAFGYIDAEAPPYTTDEVLDYYEAAGFELGVSLDHLIVPQACPTIEACRVRYEMTLANARDFLAGWRARRAPFVPVGAAQGWDPASYRDAVAALQQMGYRTIALGGLVRSKTHQILDVLAAVAEVRRRDVQLHLFGVAREAALTRFWELGVASFDSASHLRRAWLGITHNYHAEHGAYGALRIPQCDRGRKVRQMLARGAATLDELRAKERAALAAVRAWAASAGHGAADVSVRGARCAAGDRRLETEGGRGDLQPAAPSLDAALAAVLDYDRLIGDAREHLAPFFRRTLAERPWERCPCPICRALGVEVVIFRGNNRNRRRGFHNTWVFHGRLRCLRQRLGIPEPAGTNAEDA